MSTSFGKLIVILGPTAGGKSDLALKLAKKFGGEIVSADSRQIYKGMDIGTAKSLKLKVENRKLKNKIKKKYIILNGIPHHLIDIVSPNQEFTLAQYKKRAVKIIKDISKRGKISFLVGGTGLYISAVADNWQIPEVKPDKKLREKIEKEIKEKGLGKVWRKLLKLNPQAEETVDKNNPRRVIRALEICLSRLSRQGGGPGGQWPAKGAPLFEVLPIGLDMPREKLYQKINERVDKMMEAGLLEEVKRLAKKYPWTKPSMSGIGYKQIGMYLRGELTLKNAVELIKRDTRHYAKRQMTWFRRDKRIKWIKNQTEAEKLIKKFI